PSLQFIETVSDSENHWTEVIHPIPPTLTIVRAGRSLTRDQCLIC
ncbi:MAG: hypothetical protein ACI822_003079, partial [Gammaproteobacteria bacterium]